MESAKPWLLAGVVAAAAFAIQFLLPALLG